MLPAIDEAIVLDADGARLTQVFANLVNNAAKYTPTGGEVRLEVRTDAHAATVLVHDTGIGIESDMRDRVFDLFARVEQARHDADSGLGGRVLIVDDNVDAADTLAMLLEPENCDVQAVYSGERALEMARIHRPDLVLLDLGMPGLDGATVCRRLRDEPWASHVFIVAVTGWGQAEDRRRTKTAGFDQHLVKPVDPDVLAQLVRDLPSEEGPT